MNVINQLDKLYTKSGFANQYGGSIVATAFIIIVFLGLTSYFYIKGHLSKIRANWVEKRCHPQYIPFAGMIHPEKGKSTFDTTSENFNYCMNGILGEISEYETEPIYYVIAAIHSVLRSVTGAVQVFRLFAKEIRDSIVRVFDEIYAKIEAVLVPIHLIFRKNKDIINRAQGIMITVIYGVFAAYESLRSFLGAFIELVIIALIILAAVITVLFASFFGIPAAIAFLAIFVTAVGLITPVIVWSEELLDVTSNKKVPAKPSCFSGDTRYNVYSKSWFRGKKECKKKIKHIQPGDEIVRNKKYSIPQIVTATMKMSGYLTDIVNIDGVRVSSNHPVEWTEELREKAREQREEKYLDTIEISRVNLLRRLQIGHTYPAKVISRAVNGNCVGNHRRLSKMYCLGTTSKVLRLGNINATDWDELEESDIDVLREYLSRALHNRYSKDKSSKKLIDESYPRLSRTTLSWIHRYLDYGLHGDTNICVDTNGSTRKLSSLKIGSKIVIPINQSVPTDEFKIKKILIQDVVIGIVKIETDLLSVYEYEWYDVWNTDTITKHQWVGSANCMRYVRSNEVFTSQKLPAFYSKYDTTLNWTDGFNVVEKPKYLYNIVTGTGLMMANDVVMYDYNGGIDNILGETKINVPRNC